MLVDMEPIENKSNISIMNVLSKHFRVARTEAVVKYNFKMFFLSKK